jgi:hypothetical protein
VDDTVVVEDDYDEESVMAEGQPHIVSPPPTITITAPPTTPPTETTTETTTAPPVTPEITPAASGVRRMLRNE